MPIPPLPALEPVLRLAPSASPGMPSGAGVALVNFNTTRQTLRCLESLRASSVAPDWVVVLDNASREEEFALLAQGCAAFPHSELRIYRSAENLGFAAGSNFLVDALLGESGCRYLMLLNNDAVARPDMLGRLVEAVSQTSGNVGLAGGRMNRLAVPDEADTLGITLYASLMPANRLEARDPFLGPTGGCCLATRDLVEQAKAASGYFYDPRYFCYCEDTDLALRAVLMGFHPAYVEDLVALHEGQASTGGVDSSFIAYHGLRNLIWMHAKLVPGPMLLKYAIPLLAAHALTLARQALVGHFVLMLKVYRDALRELPSFRRERRRFAAQSRRISWRELDRLIAPRFYRQGYLQEVLGRIARRYLDARP